MNVCLYFLCLGLTLISGSMIHHQIAQRMKKRWIPYLKQPMNTCKAEVEWSEINEWNGMNEEMKWSELKWMKEGSELKWNVWMNKQSEMKVNERRVFRKKIIDSSRPFYDAPLWSKRVQYLCFDNSTNTVCLIKYYFVFLGTWNRNMNQRMKKKWKRFVIWEV